MAASPLLRTPGLLRYFLGFVVRTLGGSMRTVAVGWELYERTNSAWALGLVGLVGVVPSVALSLIAGDVADRYSRRLIGTIALCLQACVGVGLAIVSFTHAPVWIVYALLFVAGIAGAFAGPALSALLPELAGPELLVRVTVWLSACWQIGAMAGPAVAGLLLARFGAPWLYLLDGASALGVAIVTASLPTRGHAEVAAAPRHARDLRAGLRFVLRCRELLAVITLDLFAVLLGGAVALLPIFARDILRVGPRGLGIMLAAPSVGAAVCALALTRMRPWAHSGWALLVSVAGFGVATLGFGLSRSFPLSVALLFLTGVFDSVSLVIRRTLQQLVVPDRLRGRVGAVVVLVFGDLSDELGVLESGASAALLGAVGSVLLGGVGTLVVVAIVAIAAPSLRRMGKLDELTPREDLARAVLDEPQPSAAV